MRWVAVAGNRQSTAGIVGQHAGGHERGVGRSCTDVIGCGRRDEQRDRADRGTTGSVSDRVRERIRSRVSRCRRVRICAVWVDADDSVRCSGVTRHRNPGANVVGEHARANQGHVGRSGSAVSSCHRVHRYRHGRCRGLPAGIGDGVAERVWPGIADGWNVGVGAVCGHRQRSVCRAGVRGDSQSGAGVVGQDGGAVQGGIGRSHDGIVGRHRSHGQVHGGARRLPCCVSDGVGERVWSAVSGGWRVGVGAVRRERESAVAWVGMAADRQG